MLTWSGSPENSVDIQWRTNTDVHTGMVKYWLANTQDTMAVEATKYIMEDRLLQNDRFINRFKAKLIKLLPGAKYQYQAGSKPGNWSSVAQFETAAQLSNQFSFIWFGDTHRSPQWGQILQKAYNTYPEAAFYSIAGDVVSTGLYRDEWDKLFQFSGEVFRYRPLMPVPGNHDNQDGLGAWMYREMFSLPVNGPETVKPELTYSFNYKNALFLMIDATAPVSDQTAWIEKTLANSSARWKFAMFHFPPYSYEEDYSQIRKEWCSLFDCYHVDIVMSGHVHYYMRSKPVYDEKVVDSPAKGTIYIISIGIPVHHEKLAPEDFAVNRDTDGWLYQHIDINDNLLTYKCLDIEGNIRDEFVIKK